jgi:hypothetical protein
MLRARLAGTFLLSQALWLETHNILHNNENKLMGTPCIRSAARFNRVIIEGIP